MSLPDIIHIVSLLESGKSQEARPMLDLLVRRVPGHISARVLMARLLAADGDDIGALQHWKVAAHLCPGNPVVEKGLKRALLRVLPLMGTGAFASAVPAPSVAVSPSAPQSRPLPSTLSDEPAGPSIPTSWTRPGRVGFTPDQLAERAEGRLRGQEESTSNPVEQIKLRHPEEHGLEFQDLDKLIHELETARIVPDPHVKMIPHGELETEIDDVVSETLAHIYANQKFFEEAAIVYDKLAKQRPDQAEEFSRKAVELRQRS